MAALTATVTATHLNLRRDPSTAHAPLDSLPRGTHLRILDRTGGWFQVRVNGRTGFVHGDFVMIDPVIAPKSFLCEDDNLCSTALSAPASIPDGVARNQVERATARTWNRCGGLLAPLGDTVGVPRAAAVAVLCVESSGKGFVNGRMVIRFENHVFWNQWGSGRADLFHAHFTFDGAKRWTGHRFREERRVPWRGSHTSQETEWDALGIARELHEAAALRSISMGASQIMGFNHGRIGYDSVRTMFERFSADERFQVLGMFDFIKGAAATSAMLEALRREQYEQFATGYNGTGQAAEYGARIRAHVDAFRSVVKAAGLA